MIDLELIAVAGSALVINILFTKLIMNSYFRGKRIRKQRLKLRKKTKQK